MKVEAEVADLPEHCPFAGCRHVDSLLGACLGADGVEAVVQLGDSLLRRKTVEPQGDVGHREENHDYDNAEVAQEPVGRHSFHEVAVLDVFDCL